MRTCSEPKIAHTPVPDQTKEFWLGTPEQDAAIIKEIYKALISLGADSWLAGTVNSWKSTMPAAPTLVELRRWNAYYIETLRNRIRHYETVYPPDCSPVEDGQTSQSQSQIL